MVFLQCTGLGGGAGAGGAGGAPNGDATPVSVRLPNGAVATGYYMGGEVPRQVLSRLLLGGLDVEHNHQAESRQQPVFGVCAQDEFMQQLQHILGGQFGIPRLGATPSAAGAAAGAGAAATAAAALPGQPAAQLGQATTGRRTGRHGPRAHPAAAAAAAALGPDYARQAAQAVWDAQQAVVAQVNESPSILLIGF